MLIEDFMAKLDDKIHKGSGQGQETFGGSFDEAMFISTNNRVLELTDRKKQIGDRLAKAMTDGNMEELRQIIVDCEIADPGIRLPKLDRSATVQPDVQHQSWALWLMLQIPSTSARDSPGHFVNFLNVQKTTRQKVPFGIAQIGKAFRNEIVARQFIFRMREFEQMEMQYFVRPGEEDNWYSYWKEHRMKWHKSLGTDDSMLKFPKTTRTWHIMPSCGRY